MLERIGAIFRSGGKQPLETVSSVDMHRYTGVWYEIARYPNRFQRGCAGSKATYALRSDGKLDVLNECRDKGFSGRMRCARGVARIVDRETNAKLKVSFFWPFAGDYWIIDLGKNYEYAVVGHPQRKYLWILSRKEDLDKELYRSILERLESQGYDTARISLSEKYDEGETA